MTAIFEPRLMRVMVPARPFGPRTKQRWIAQDFRTGTHRTREGARRAFRRALCPDPYCRSQGVLASSPSWQHPA